MESDCAQGHLQILLKFPGFQELACFKTNFCDNNHSKLSCLGNEDGIFFLLLLVRFIEMDVNTDYLVMLGNTAGAVFDLI
jgi:hypothetical protein